ncbi:serine/threonine-protein kinase PLK2-like [Heptranchias perlo]|uniref:serine/threonine-protein kinase PLK2-like n=1 Tax=Heptranchias perlo TaxID=212740 RepID=UPI003559F82B
MAKSSGKDFTPRARGHRLNLNRLIRDPTTGSLYYRGDSLGKGAFAKSYQLIEVATNKILAVKVMPLSRAPGAHQREEIEKEIELHSTLHHRNVVSYYHHFEDTENIYIILEYCSRKTLAHILKARKVLTEPEARHYLRQIVSGLKYLHHKGIVHRDLKLSNLFVNKNMEVKIGDFGLATKLEEQKRGIICGTRSYLAPEVLSMRRHVYKSDIWALGCVFYTMLSGHLPFKISDIKDTYQMLREAKYSIPNSLSPAAQHLTASLLAKNPEDRPSLDEIIQHDFFTQGLTPENLSPSCCYTSPTVSTSKNLLERAGKYFFRKKKGNKRFPDHPENFPIEQDEVINLSRGLKMLKANEQCKIRHNGSEVGEGEMEKMVPISPVYPLSKTQPPVGQDQLEPNYTHQVRVLARGTLGSRNSGSKCEGDCTVESIVDSVARVLKGCLENMPEGDQNPEDQLNCSLLWVTKWIDYSNKYGFGYQLSDSSTGILLNNGSHMTLLPHAKSVCCCTELGHWSVFPMTDVPRQLSEQLTVLQFFTQYMEEHLMQVNFYHDHTKIILCNHEEEYVLTFINRDRMNATFRLSTLLLCGCSAEVRRRMEYTYWMLQQL